MTLRPFPSRLAAIAPTALLLASCAQDGPPPEPPLPTEALEAVVVEPGISRETLARALDEVFEADGVGETRAVIVMREGEIVAERYAEGFDAETRHMGWSLSKAVTAALVGMVVADGRIGLDDPAPVPAWQRAGDPRSEITLRQLLQMRSGLRHTENSQPIYDSPEVQMMYGRGRGDMAAWAEAQPLAFDPGTQFAYSTPTTVILADIATDLIAEGSSPDERQQAMAEFVDARLAVPLGMASLVGECDVSGTLLGGSHFYATARDWARFGEFLRRGGVADGVQVVPRGWIDFMRQPSPASPDYGAQIWLNRDSGEEREVLFPGQGPESAFAMVGRGGQYVIVSPEDRLTVVRLGNSTEEQLPTVMAELADIFALYSGK